MAKNKKNKINKLTVNFIYLKIKILLKLIIWQNFLKCKAKDILFINLISYINPNKHYNLIK
jgi:hypothetical protein